MSVEETMAVDLGMRVLVVDDYKTMIRIIRNLLKQLGFVNVDEASDGSAALNMMRSKDYGLVISDWNMEPMTGYELLREVRADDTLARMTIAAQCRPRSCRLVYGHVRYFDHAGECVYREGEPWDKCAGEMAFRNAIPHIGMLHERSIFDEGAQFDAAFRIAGDYDLVRRETQCHGAYFVRDVVAAHASWGGLSTRADLELQSVREVGRIIRRQDGRHPPAIWYWRCGKVMLSSYVDVARGQTGSIRSTYPSR